MLVRDQPPAPLKARRLRGLTSAEEGGQGGLVGGAELVDPDRENALHHKGFAAGASLFDVTSGSNGRCVKGHTTTGAYLCTGVAGYDGPTGNGTPIGTSAY